VRPGESPAFLAEQTLSDLRGVPATMTTYRAILILLIFAVSSSPAVAGLISGIAAIVNDEIITTRDVDKQYASILKEAEKLAAVSEDDRKKFRDLALNQLVDRKLIDMKIADLNIKISEEEVRQAIEDVKKQNKLSQESLVEALRGQGVSFDQYRAQLREQLERIRLMSQEVRAKIQVGEKDIRDFYDANQARYREDERFRARHIFFRLTRDTPADEVKKVMAKALNVLQEAKSGKDFTELAKKNSDDPTVATDGGYLGIFKKGEMLQEIEDAVVVMKPGTVSDIVSTPEGLHIIKLEERIPGKLKPLSDIRGEIEDTLYKMKSEERFNQWLAELKKNASIEIKQ
jgi:peptidyl-prolyl cis-trans isomerase SurA